MSGPKAELSHAWEALTASRIDVNGENRQPPKFVYSYSSMGFHHFVERLRSTWELVPRCLVSLYDIHYHLGDDLSTPSSGVPWRRFLDSGQYEARAERALLEGLHLSIAQRGWRRDEYHDVLSKVVGAGDVVVGFDDETMPLRDQVTSQLETFSGLSSDVFRDLLLIPSPEDIVTDYLDLALGSIALVGFPDTTLGPNIVERLRKLVDLRRKLNVLTAPLYLPIHVFGCLDPRTVTLMYLAGADVFDGLAWMRYYFSGAGAMAQREFALLQAIDVDEGPDLDLKMLRLNIARMEQLANDLDYSVRSGDYGGFRTELSILATTLGIEG